MLGLLRSLLRLPELQEVEHLVALICLDQLEAELLHAADEVVHGVEAGLHFRYEEVASGEKKTGLLFTNI